MDNKENIIQIRKRDIRQADLAFADFMDKYEKYFNDKAKANVELYRKCDGQNLEKLAESLLKEIAPSTPFLVDDIKLVSGAKFPDIQAGKYYGVEVKSTKSNSWTSTGSSIIESTRIPDVTKIYLLFGKLGGVIPEYRCKPYEQCLSNIAVTHSPRYLIDMALNDNHLPNIFDKMKVDYDTFRLLTEKEKIQKVRIYLKASIQEKNKKKKFELPWWIGEENSEESSSALIRFFSDVNMVLQDKIKSRMFVLFPELFRNNYNQKYKRAALWMCSRYSLIDNCLRDKFTAGGKVEEIGNVWFEKPIPQIINTLYTLRNQIYELLTEPDDSLLEDISDFWPVDCLKGLYYECWLGLVQTEFDNNPELNNINIRELFLKWDVGKNA